MKLFKAKASLFSGSYYKELLKELMVLGIVCAALQLFYGIMGEFGEGASNSPLVLLFGFGMNRVHPDTFSLYFFASALSFLFTHVHRKNWDFRNSLPIAKRTMFACHFAAVMTWAAIIFIANFIGVFIGEGLRIAMSSTSLPDGFGMSAASMIKSVISGVTSYCIIVIIASVVNRVFSVLAAFGVVIGLPILFIGFEGYIRYRGMDTLELFFPLGINGLETFKLVVSILFALLLIVVAFIAYGKSRVETFQKPARTETINVLIGLGVAACVGIIATIIFERGEFMHYYQSGPKYESSIWYLCIVYACIPMLIAYFIFMWISQRSFVRALKKLVFLPLVLVVFGAAILIAMIADKKWEKLDFSVENIDYVRIKDEHFGLNSQPDYYDYAFFSSGSQSRGSSKAFNVKHTDSAVLLSASTLAKDSKDYSDDSVNAIFQRFANQVSTKGIEITLKDGTKWGVVSRNHTGTRGRINLEDVEDNKEYIDALGSLDRFKNGKVIYHLNLGSEFNKTLLDELASLSSIERARIFISAASNNWGSPYVHDSAPIFKSDEWSSSYGYTLMLASPTYDHVSIIDLGEQLPKTTELFMKLMDEKTRSHKDYGEFITMLKNASFAQLEGRFIVLKDGKMLEHGLNLEGSASPANGVASTDKEYSRMAGEICTLLAECIEAKEPIENASTVIGLDIHRFCKSLDEYYYYGEYSFEGISPKLFVGVSGDKAEKLMKLIGEFNEKYNAYNYDDFPFQYEFEIITEAVSDGRLKLYDQSGNELTVDDMVGMYKNGYQWFYVENGEQNFEQLFIVDIFTRLMEQDEDTL